MKRLLAGVAVLTLALSGCASVPGEPVAVGQLSGSAVGAVLSIEGRAGTADVTVETARWKPSPKATYGGYLTVVVAVTATAGQVNVSPYDWSIRDSQGYTRIWATVLNDGFLAEQTVKAGTTIRGNLVFDVADAGSVVVFQPFMDRPGYEWRVDAH